MLKRMKALRNEKGLTLIELLVVIVILGIIAAIAVVAIGGILENSKKDAVVGSAQQMISAAKLGVAAGEFKPSGNAESVTIQLGDASTPKTLIGEGYLDTFTGPNGGPPTSGHVKVEGFGANNYKYKVTLTVDGFTIPETDEAELDRSKVQKN